MDILVTENYGQLDHEIRLSAKSIAAAGYLHIFIHTA